MDCHLTLKRTSNGHTHSSTNIFQQNIFKLLMRSLLLHCNDIDPRTWLLLLPIWKHCFILPLSSNLRNLYEFFFFSQLNAVFISSGLSKSEYVFNRIVCKWQKLAVGLTASKEFSPIFLQIGKAPMQPKF